MATPIYTRQLMCLTLLCPLINFGRNNVFISVCTKYICELIRIAQAVSFSFFPLCTIDYISIHVLIVIAFIPNLSNQHWSKLVCTGSAH